MRILVISNMFPPDADGGLEVNAQKISVGLRERGNEVVVLTARHRPQYAGPPEDRPWVRRELDLAPPIRIEGGLRGKFQLAATLRKEVAAHLANQRVMARLLDAEPFDVVYTFGLSLIGPSLLIEAQRRGVPFLIHQGGNYLEARYGYSTSNGRLANSIRAKLSAERELEYPYMAYVSQHLINESKSVGAIGANRWGERILQIIPRGIEFELGLDIDRERAHPPTFIMAGRIIPIKGFHNAITALGRLFARRPDLAWKLEIAGEPDEQDVVSAETGAAYFDQLKHQIAEAGIQDRVVFLGRIERKQLVEHMKRSAAFISASTVGEGFANTIIEAMASGTASIISNDGSALEQVTPDVSALVFEKHDLETLEKHIERVLDEPALRLSLAEGGLREIQERYSLAKVLDLTEQTLQRVIDDARARSGKPGSA